MPSPPWFCVLSAGERVSVCSAQRMKSTFVLLFLLLIILGVECQSDPPSITEPSVAPECDGPGDYQPCILEYVCNGNSMCFCKDGQPYCRCNNYKDEWYIGEDCSQRWTTLNFALVASLPGLALAVLVGVTVQFACYKKKPAKGSKVRSSKDKSQPNQQQNDDMFRNMVFASDLQGRPNFQPQPQGIRPPQDKFPMAAIPNQTYVPQSRPQMGGPAPYSSQSNMRESLDQQPMGGIQPFKQSNMRASVNRQPLGGPQPSYQGPGMGQVLSNPYAKLQPGRNPYENRSPSPDHYDNNPFSENGTRENTSGFPWSTPPTYAAPEYNSQSQFPRAQISQY
ncbi:uncharacterized protein LOC114792846 [Denticeps clupeoides]|uniref:uncharacterized protein LOC114792846 n=1 Tax=Denticeps clupeoides TaxID=299321 RepID=UPI0010A2FA4F|nr:uncharacterized protein LOC114792846 [Denticeps clupeoides]